MFSPTWYALQNEASLGAEMICSGLTLLRKANHAEKMLYNQGFFNLTIGFERTLKLILVIDYLFTHGSFPSNKTLRSYGHSIINLVKHAKTVAEKYNINFDVQNTEIKRKIIDLLTEFAKSSRYYNLDFLANVQPSLLGDPIAYWNQAIGELIIQKHPVKDFKEHEKEMMSVIDSFSLFMFANENQEPLTNAFDNFTNHRRTEQVQKYGCFYIYTIARTISKILNELRFENYRKYRNSNIPDFNDFYRVLMNPDDSYVKRRKTWKII